MTENAQQIVEHVPTGDLPEAPAPKTLDALRSYLVRPEVKNRLVMACAGDHDKMKAVAAGIYVAIETAEDPGALLACSPRSIVNAAILSIQHNLPLDGRKLAFLTPRRNKHRNELCAVLAPSYHGFEYVVRQRHADFEGRAEFKFAEDEFEILREGGLESYRHKPANPFRDDYRKAEGLFYHYTYTDDNGKTQSIVYTLPMSEVLKSETIAPKKEVWQKWFRAQAKKTVIRSALSSKFKTLVQPIEELDNQHFDVNSEELKKEGVYAVDPIQQVIERDRAKRGLPPLIKDAPTAQLEVPEETEATTVAETAEDSAPDAPSDATEVVAVDPMVIDGEIVEAVAEDAAPETCQEVFHGWDGTDVVMPDGRVVTRKWKSPAHAGAYLAAALATVTSIEDKEQIAEENEDLLMAIKISGNEDLYNSLGEMLGYGDTQRSGATSA